MEHTRKTFLHTPRSVFRSEPHLSINSSSPVPPEQTNGGRLSAAPQYLYLTLESYLRPDQRHTVPQRLETPRVAGICHHCCGWGLGFQTRARRACGQRWMNGV
jgi:hypothetical protein